MRAVKQATSSSQGRHSLSHARTRAERDWAKASRARRRRGRCAGAPARRAALREYRRRDGTLSGGGCAPGGRREAPCLPSIPTFAACWRLAPLKCGIAAAEMARRRDALRDRAAPARPRAEACLQRRLQPRPAARQRVYHALIDDAVEVCTTLAIFSHRIKIRDPLKNMNTIANPSNTGRCSRKYRPFASRSLRACSCGKIIHCGLRKVLNFQAAYSWSCGRFARAAPGARLQLHKLLELVQHRRQHREVVVDVLGRAAADVDVLLGPDHLAGLRIDPQVAFGGVPLVDLGCALFGCSTSRRRTGLAAASGDAIDRNRRRY